MSGPRFRFFYPVVHAVSDEMNDRLPDFVQDALIDFELAPERNNPGLLALIVGKVADDLRHHFEERRKGQHGHGLQIFEKTVHQAADGTQLTVG